MPSQRRHFRLPAFGTSFRRTFRQKFCFWHHKRCTVAPSTYSQGWEDTATTEVEPADKYQSPAGSSGATQSSNAIHQYHGQCSTAPPGQVQGPEDATTPEAGPEGKIQCPVSRHTLTSIKRRLAGRGPKVEPASWDGASETQPKPEKQQLGAMAAPSPEPHEIPAPSLELENRAVASVGHFRRLWRGVRDRKNRVGLVEIDNNNEYYIITKMIQAGLWAASQVSIDNPPKGPATLKEFAEVRTQVHKEGFQLQILAGPAFARLRKRVGVTEQDYQAALGPGNPYLQFISTSKSKASFFLSTSKSKASFFLSHDQRFFLKTQTRKEVQVLLSQLYSYVQHLVQYPHSLLAKLLGIYSLRVANRAKKYFIVIENIFYPVSRISERYDIKACTLSRWVEPVPEDSPLLLVLKDLNFDGKTIDLGPQRSWFLRQIKVDIEFLRGHGVLDYSLLVGIQPLHEDEKNRFSFVRTIRSVYGGPEGQNRRLLPDVPNALHVLDGPEKRYFLGLVDVTTIFGFRKRMEQLWKTIRHPGQSFSTVSPDHYARRMIQWVETHTK